MRLKKDNSSWKSGGIKKRDYRHDKSEPRPKPQRAKKDKAKWCKGKVGIHHQFEVESQEAFSLR